MQTKQRIATAAGNTDMEQKIGARLAQIEQVIYSILKYSPSCYL